ncbi:MAG: endopeptidase La [Deltaproteobacteria bacterium]|nr:endopeptidase La [Deltaproteobacteria bacterium]
MSMFRKTSTPAKVETASELDGLRQAVMNAQLPEKAEKIAFKELSRLTKMSPAMAEYTIGANYLDYLISLPWNALTADNLDIRRAAAVLDEAHFGLKQIKDRILEHLAVRILKLSRKYHILVVDDEKMTRMNLEHVFTKDGYRVTTAATGAEAIALLDRQPVDIVVTDLKMEHVDGMSVLTHAKAKDPGIAVIIITGYATIPAAIEAMQKGSHHFLAKPFKLDEIRATTDRALLKKRAQLESRGPILCFAGPPGTGKTSLGKSIARSLERNFIRMSMAGIKDEAEIRGHRRSYMGALPGRIIQEIRRAGTRNPVFMLDELDKIGQEFKGDPAAALLEVLDPEQNAAFVDHYLDIPFDLSKVMFIATANTTDSIPGPLLDRLEVIRLAGYTDTEKEQIAMRYIVPREIREAGLVEASPEFTPEAIQIIIKNYTREAGLRNLQRAVAAICRKKARERLLDAESSEPIRIGPVAVVSLLGPARDRPDIEVGRDQVGIATGLAWTEAGGEIMFIEATKMRGNNRLILTGSLGNVMKESAQAALSYIRSQNQRLGIPEDFFESHDIHIHVPAGATPKDGPSAGLTIAVALISLISNRPARRNMALTGELTLSGRILPIGGIKEKLMAASRCGVKVVVLPAKNKPDLEEIPEEVLHGIEIIPIEELWEIIDEVLTCSGTQTIEDA